ncbi:MAG: DUF6089 family protein [Ginsengibacter sp.]
MKFRFFFILLFATNCKGQEWEAEIMPGVMGYNGDLTQKRFSIEQLKPAIKLNLKYNSGDFINLRFGIGYGKVGADDRNNKAADLKSRNLNFKSDILEINVIAEVGLLDPEVFTAYPYIFGGVGVFHFNPYTYDNENKKTYLRPLSTEGQGLKEYPDRKKYALTQFCIPVGVGWKMTIKEKWDISYEFGYNILFTDYLDDVSKTYASLNVLATEKNSKSAELAYRGDSPFLYEGEARGNPTIKDIYFFSGIKIATPLNNIFHKN